jgi:hypothetical protein
MLIGAVPLACLTGCVSQAVPRSTISDQVSLVPICPNPTPDRLKSKIADELGAAIERGVPPGNLAAEWERLNDGSMICRRSK